MNFDPRSCRAGGVCDLAGDRLEATRRARIASALYDTAKRTALARFTDPREAEAVRSSRIRFSE